MIPLYFCNVLFLFDASRGAVRYIKTFFPYLSSVLHYFLFFSSIGLYKVAGLGGYVYELIITRANENP